MLVFVCVTLHAFVLADNVKTLVVSDVPVLQKLENEGIIKPTTASKKLLSMSNGTASAEITVKSSVDSLYKNHGELFSASPLDQVFYTKNTWDVIFEATVNPWIKTKFAARSKATWGNETSVLVTTDATFKSGDAVTGSHNHNVGKLVPWIREAWMDFSVNKAFGMDESLQHRVKIGVVPFTLGRGISYSSSISASSGILGFYASSVVDQHAFAQLLYGDIKKDQLSYNFYTAVLENSSDMFSRVNAAVYANQIGRRDNPERGFGKINFVIASNLKWTVLDGKHDLGKLSVEPYLMYNKSPEQKVEFTADASSNLATCGLCMDYVGSQFEWGFDMAANFGAQKVRSWDRNQVEVFCDTDGVVKNRYSYVKSGSATGTKALYTSGVKTLVNSAPQSAELNGTKIGTVTSVDYYNDASRFRAGYTNKYKGIMLVVDGAWNLRQDKKLRLVGTAGWATGDENPNKNLDDVNDSEKDSDFQGFIGLQGIYSGKRVPSIFVLGDNDIVRPLSAPSVPGFATNISGFTNLVYVGGGVDWRTKIGNKGLRIKPNVLSYWQDKATKKYDATNQTSLNEYANKHLGVEVSTTFRMSLLNELSGFLVGGVFIPGKHYDDIKGKPLNGTQLAALDDLDSTGYPSSGVPVVGTTAAYVISWGLELSF